MLFYIVFGKVNITSSGTINEHVVVLEKNGYFSFQITIHTLFKIQNILIDHYRFLSAYFPFNFSH